MMNTDCFHFLLVYALLNRMESGCLQFSPGCHYLSTSVVSLRIIWGTKDLSFSRQPSWIESCLTTSFLWLPQPSPTWNVPTLSIFVLIWPFHSLHLLSVIEPLLARNLLSSFLILFDDKKVMSVVKMELWEPKFESDSTRVWPWTSCFPSLGFSFLICDMSRE